MSLSNGNGTPFTEHIENLKHKWSLCVHLLSANKELSTLWLPCHGKGFYRFSDELGSFLAFQGNDDSWVVECNDNAFFWDSAHRQMRSMKLGPDELLSLEFDGHPLYLFAEDAGLSSLTYQNFNTHSEADITIGSANDKDIQFRSSVIPAHSATLSRKNHQWSISYLHSDCLMYVNGHRAECMLLHTGDALFLMGLHIIIGPRSVCVNSVGNRVSVRPDIIKISFPHRGGYGYNSDLMMSADEISPFFNRLPRKYVHWNSAEISIEAPPMSISKDKIPLLLRMGGSMVMGGRAALSGNLTMLLSSVFFPFLTSKFTEKEQKKYEESRIRYYTAYLQEQKEKILKECSKEEQFYRACFPSVEDLLIQMQNDFRLWERRPKDEDFLSLRLGHGSRISQTKINYPDRHFSLETDPLEDQMYQLAEREYFLDNMPVTVSLLKDRVCGFLGPRSMLLELAFQLLMQVVVYHSYDEVKIIFLAEQNELESFPDIHFLPHIWNDQKNFRFLATNEVEACAIGEYIKNCASNVKTGAADSSTGIHYVVFALNSSIFNNIEALKSILNDENDTHFSFLALYDELPKECRKVISLKQADACTVQQMQDTDENDASFMLDLLDHRNAQDMILKLSNLRLKSISMEQELPKTLPFLEMFHVGTVGRLNVLKRWSDNDPIKSLATPVGVHIDGTPFVLDLHEKRQGPHGLVAGMTGSGKSEFIITFILSMAVNYHPDEVAFILIDYKGGGLADAFDNPRTGLRLPHLVGTITNLDGAEITRSLISLESELLRRQHVLHQAKNLCNEGTLDIYGYQKLYREGKVDQPMPHLFIICDEFAELKTQQPQFMDKLNSTARIGRSLGIHLILATQKPSGVVDEQIRSNSKFRVCLRVQDRSDSEDMLRRPDAAELKDTGRFYLQVGYNEYFALGQSAWSGSPYIKQQCDSVPDYQVEFLGANGQLIAKAKPQPKAEETGLKQISAVVAYLTQVAKEIGYQSHCLWVPALMDRIAWDDDAPVAPLEVSAGLVDDPRNQAQYPLTLNLPQCQHLMIVGSAGSGKSTLLQNMIRSLVLRNSPESLNFYVLDYSSRAMKRFSSLPHCGGVLLEEDEESLQMFFDMIQKIIKKRKLLFSQLNVSSYEEAVRVQPLPLVLVVIDNISGLSMSKIGERILYNFSSFLKGTPIFGIQFLISCNHPNDLSNQIKRNIGTRICLHTADKYTYGDVLNCNVTNLPPNKPGRGLFCRNGQPLEIQLAMNQPNSDDKSRTASLAKEISDICDQYRTSASILHMPVFSPTAKYEDFASQFEKHRIPLGISATDKKPIALPFKQFSALGVYFGNPNGIIPVTENFLFAARREGMRICIIKQSHNSCFSSGSQKTVNLELLRNATLMDNSPEAVSLFLDNLNTGIHTRKARLKELAVQDGISFDALNDIETVYPYLAKNFQPVFIYLEHFSEFCSTLDQYQSVILSRLFEVAYLRNIFIMTGYYPNDPDRRSVNLLYSGFNLKDNLMFFGGSLNRQSLCTMGNALDGKILPFNTCIMKYRGNFFSLIMPCGDISSVSEDPDSQSIF